MGGDGRPRMTRRSNTVRSKMRDDGTSRSILDRRSSQRSPRGLHARHLQAARPRWARARSVGKMGLKVGVIAALALSVFSSVSLVIVNKYLISTLMFPYGARGCVLRCEHELLTRVGAPSQ